jgi:uncharacterized protein
VFLDSSCFFALANRNDAYHHEAVAIGTRLINERCQAIATNLVVAATHALFVGRLGHDQASSLLEQIYRSSTIVVRVTVQDEARARDIARQYDDRDFSLIDALSFAVIQRLVWRSPLRSIATSLNTGCESPAKLFASGRGFL